MPDKLRFGLLARETIFQQWEAECLEQMLAVEGVELALLLVDARPPARPNPWYRKWKALRHANTLAWELYRRHVVEKSIPLRRPVDLSSRLASVPRLDIHVNLRGRYSEYFPPADIETVRTMNLDFLLRFGFNILRGDVLNITPYGMWSFHHGDLHRYRGSPPGFWEVYRGDPVTGVTLQKLTDKLDSGVVLRKETFPTCLDSYRRNLECALRLGISWPADLCRRLLAGDTTSFDAPPAASTAPIYRAPTNLQMARFLGLRRV